MSRLQGRPEVVTNYVEAVGFSFYTDEEKHSISVKQITSPVLFDNLKNPVVGGLYDPALGPLNQQSTCTTCRQPQLHCTGHFGHIDLTLPVYNPLVFKELVKILKWICVFCHHFKMHEQRVGIFATKLELIAEGRMVEAARVQLPRSDDEEGAGINLSDEDVDTVANNILTTKSGNPRTQWTSTQLAAARTVIARFKEDMPKTKCENCLAHIPTVKHSGVGKIFQEPLSSNHRSNNIMRGIRNTVTLRSISKKASAGDEMDGGEEAFDAMDIDEINMDAMDSSTPSKKSKGGKASNAKSSGFKLEDYELWTKKRFLHASEVREHIRLAWETEKRICSLVWGLGEIGGRMGLDTSGKSFSMFFLQTLLVTPNKFRPPNIMNGDVLEHPQNVFYGRIIRANIAVTEVSRGKKLEDGSTQKMDVGLAIRLWLGLQNEVCALLDSTTATGLGKDQQTGGIRQLLEKKEGLFRMNMMGKRVNYACRSVISPDPYIAVNEIGIPPYFATRLTYPERVTPWNVHQMREAVENGPQVHPGATHVEDEEGRIIGLDKLPKHKRSALAKTLLSTPGMAVRGTSVDGGRSVGKTVYRHLRDGDVLLVNRQPTLHKPGVMAHKARVLKGEKTLRLHYANCSTYNADFDGDEMNVHFPQEELGRAEAYEIVNADQQYVVPTSGDPIRGLIQDHIVSATLLTKRDTFLNKEEYHQLVYSACVSMNAANFKRKNKNVALSVIDRELPIVPLPPAIMKPEPMWTGKQVLTTVFNHITFGLPPFTLKAPIKVSGDYWGKNSGELELIVKDNELVCGVIDKAQFGKYGIVHTFQELYGPEMAGRLLSVFSRLFTAYLQMHGFTCGFGDLLLVPKAEKSRRQKLKETDNLGNKINARFVGVDEDGDAELNLEEIRDEVEKRMQSKGEAASKRLDMLMTSALNRITSDINNTIFPKGLMKPFPANCLSLMTITGAKGGLVNFTQISSLLGQQELEGKRVPRMSSGKTLPCFPPWDPSARAGGFIGDRFLTGLRPQEYYFHCMAGRDGLVDTAVKTSRSGYLQRCLMKNLESLKVHYDYTVRDSDGSIVQFRYGEDGVDVTKTSHLLKFELLAANQDLVSLRLGKDQMERPRQRNKKHKHKEVEHEDNNMAAEEPLEAMSKAFEDKVEGFIAGSKSRADKRRFHLRKHKDREDFRYLMSLKYASSLAQPGEPVGCLAAQSVGEPSTQMTLNTFHFAGRGEMNVTLGIPRLREILMTASADISTPIMTCPLLPGKTREDAERLATKLRKLRLIDLLENVEVGEVPFAVQNGQPSKVFKVRMKVYSPHRYPPHLNLEFEEIELVVREQFIPRLMKEMKKSFQSRSGKRKEDVIQVVQASQTGEGLGAGNVDNGAEDGEEPKRKKKGMDVEDGETQEDEDDEEGGDEEGADAEKRRGQDNDERGYDDDVDDAEKEIAEETQKKDLQEQAIGGDGDDDQEVTENVDRDRLYEDEDGAGDADIVPPTPDLPRKDSAKKGSTSKGEGSQKEVDGADTLTVNGTVFEMQFTVKLSTPHIILAEIVEKVASQVAVRAVTGIEKCAVIDFKGNSSNPALQTDGVNFEGIWTLSDDLDLNQLTTNNVASMLKVYGVEACRATILSEVQAVFGSYGISVNPRHLALIADFMTFQGGYRACNRLGINSSPSPFLKMSFETATVFLMDATLQKHSDYLESPSARIVMGRIVEMGTGSFDLLQNIDTMIVAQG